MGKIEYIKKARKEHKCSKSEKDRISKAQDIALDEGGLDYVIDVAPTPDFVEVVGRKGGDVVTYRVMNDGQFYER